MIDRAPTQCEVQTVPENAERHVPDQQREFIPPAKPHIGEAEIEAAVAVLRSGRVVQGPEVAAFEEEFAKVSGTAECVAVNSGTSALQLALLAMGIGPGDEVIVPSFSFAASANAVRLVGAEPVFADIEPGTFCVDPAHVEALIGPKTAAIMPVHLYGHPADMTRLTALAERRSLAILEDACQAHGAQVEGRPVGSFGAAGTFSFYPTKNMHALEGGMVSTDDPKLARTLRLLRNQGMEVRYQNEIVGANMRMTDVSAAIGRVQLTRLGEWTEQRRANAARFDAAIKTVTVPPVPPVAAGARHIYHQYTVRVPEGRDAALEQLNAAGVGSAVYYPVPIHKLAPYAHIEAELPETDRAAAEVLSLPIHPALSEGDLDRIVEAVHSLELAQ